MPDNFDATLAGVVKTMRSTYDPVTDTHTPHHIADASPANWTHNHVTLLAAAAQTILNAGNYNGIYIENTSPFAPVNISYDGTDATLITGKTLSPGESLEWAKLAGDMPGAYFSAIAAEDATLYVASC